MTNILMITKENDENNKKLSSYLKNKGHKVMNFEDLICCYMQEDNNFLGRLKKHFKPLEFGTLEKYIDNYSIIFIDDENSAYVQSIRQKFPFSNRKIVMYGNKKYVDLNNLSPQPESTFEQRTTSTIDSVAYIPQFN